MKIRCPHCQEQTVIDDADVLAYITKIKASSIISAAMKEVSKRPRPGSIGNQRAKKKTVEVDH